MLDVMEGRFGLGLDNGWTIYGGVLAVFVEIVRWMDEEAGCLLTSKQKAAF